MEAISPYAGIATNEDPLQVYKAMADPDTMYMHQAMKEPDKEMFIRAME